MRIQPDFVGTGDEIDLILIDVRGPVNRSFVSGRIRKCRDFDCQVLDIFYVT